MNTELCPCKSGLDYQKCCALLIEKKQPATSAEALMRSRYTAYAKGEIDYIIETTHPNHREKCDKDAVRTWSQNADWHGLQIVNVVEENDKGTIEFIAQYSEKGIQKKHHEISIFKKHNDTWLFDNGKEVMLRADKIGRNDPCRCGSGKKYKKCCG